MLPAMSTSPHKDTKAAHADPVAARANVAGRDLAYEGFQQQILQARLRPGQFVSQRELTELLDLPLAAVREMIPRLEAARLIRTVPKRGLQIASVDLKLVRNAFQVRAMIEREAVLHLVRHASDAKLAQIEQAHRSILERARKGEPDETLDKDAQAVDWGLHDLMVDAIGNEILSELYRVNSLHVRLIRLDAHTVRPMRIVPAMEEHLEFLEVVKKRDENAAVEKMMQHIERSKQRVLQAMLEGTFD
jgi:DNA-binding GntR family transcriptional regulator